MRPHKKENNAMEKPRLLIVNNNMHLGGVQSALAALLQQICDQWDVTLLLLYPGGELMDRIPPQVEVVSAAPLLAYWGMTRQDAALSGKARTRLLLAGLTRVLGRSVTILPALLSQRTLKGFDAAISFLHSGPDRVFYGGCNELVLSRVEAKRKFTFLHCDFAAIGGCSRSNARLYRRFDRIAACSRGAELAFLRVFPQLSDRTMVVPNCHDYAYIRAMAEKEPACLPRTGVNVLTVARFGREKGILRAAEAMAELAQQRDDFRWYVIGDGLEYAPVQALIHARGLEERMVLLGAKLQPYGYLKAADLLLIPSVSEAAPMVIGEAAVLGTPILSTRTSSAVELVQQPGLGWVCENSLTGIQEGVRRVLDDPQSLAARAGALEGMKLDNTLALRRFAELLTEERVSL